MFILSKLSENFQLLLITRGLTRMHFCKYSTVTSGIEQWNFMEKYFRVKPLLIKMFYLFSFHVFNTKLEYILIQLLFKKRFKTFLFSDLE